MSDRRIRIFIILIGAFFVLCLFRLIQMQLQPASSIHQQILELKRQRGLSRQLKTTRGRILDRAGRVLAADKPRFYIGICYSLTCFADERFQRVNSLRSARQDAYAAFPEEQRAGLEELKQVIEKLTKFGCSREEIEKEIKRINDDIWRLRFYLAWKRDFPQSSFEQAVPDADERLLLASKIDIAEMRNFWPLVELAGSDDIFTAQLEFSDVEGVGIQAVAQRYYPYGSAASQTIGWLGRATQEGDIELFEDDELSSYLGDELCGRDDGVEYVCEAVLRGRRGEEIYDIDRNLVSRVDTQPGRDVMLTLDIELQERIEEYLADCSLNQNCDAPVGVVVMDIRSSDILALVSLPDYDLNYIRQQYGSLATEPNEPLRNRAINKLYPPGSVIKPLILIAALESGKVEPGEVISCPAAKAPAGWPSCWIYNRYGIGHSGSWTNNARNAIKGSCNIYFSRIAERIEPVVLQRWLYDFGYGRKVEVVPEAVSRTNHKRDFRQEQGTISSSMPKTEVLGFEELPLLNSGERRYFGIGQGNLRVTALQVANAMGIIARGGVCKRPRLFIGDVNDVSDSVVELDISGETLSVIREGMRAVVSEAGGTAQPAFIHSGFEGRGVRVYGKTGSTEAPDTAWFAGFAQGGSGRGISIAVVVEGGQHGSSDAAPLARDIISFCIEAGYLGE